MANACGSISLGNIIPDSIVDGIKSRMENMDVFAVSFTANPMILAMLSETAIRITSPPKYVSGALEFWRQRELARVHREWRS